MVNQLDALASPHQKPETATDHTGPATDCKPDTLNQAQLGNQDLKSLVAAGKSDATASQGYLPELKMPIGVDQGVSRAHGQLSSAFAKVMPAADAQKFESYMDAFERRADVQGLTAGQIKSTYESVGKMLEGGTNSPFTPDQRKEITSQWMQHLAEPASVTRQGWHDTCGWGYLEVRELDGDPDKITAKMAELATTGSVSTFDINKVKGMMISGNMASDLPMKQLTIDRGSLQPDVEAQGAGHWDDRQYADQVAQVMLNNIRWDGKVRTPDGKDVPAGSMKYEQCHDVSRPADGLPNGVAPDKSCESITWTDPATGRKVVDNDHSYGFGGPATAADLAYVDSVVTGHNAQMDIEREDAHQAIDQESSIMVSSVDDLLQELQDLKASGQLPIGALVEVKNKGVIEDYLARHPEKTADQVSRDSWHFVMVKDLDDEGNVQVYNPWGVQRTLTVEELYQALGNPA